MLASASAGLVVGKLAILDNDSPRSTLQALHSIAAANGDYEPGSIVVIPDLVMFTGEAKAASEALVERLCRDFDLVIFDNLAEVAARD